MEDIFPGSNQLRLLGLDQADDVAVWNTAAARGFMLVTQDSDFADRAALLGPPPKVIWLRCGNQTTVTIEKLIREHQAAIEAFEKEPSAACLEIY